MVVQILVSSQPGCRDLFSAHHDDFGSNSSLSATLLRESLIKREPLPGRTCFKHFTNGTGDVLYSC